MIRLEEYDHFPPEWCPGCGNFDTLASLKSALQGLEIRPEDFILVAGIGQASKAGFSLRCNLFDGLHGRALPAALGIKMANHEARVIVVSGDGCIYAEGGNHLIHNMRRNLDITLLAVNNRVYGLTKGQASPTSPIDFKTKLQREGTGSAPLNPILLALVSGATFVARTFSGSKEEQTEMIRQGILHRGFSLIDIMSPCISFNKVHTFGWYKERIEPIDPEHDVTNLESAMRFAMNGDDRIPTGVIFRTDRPVFGEHMAALRDGPIVGRDLDESPDRVKALIRRFR
ncbi:thiamine pyrophosphate-dependent enzyme [Thermodesulfobacteriota bacterium]